MALKFRPPQASQGKVVPPSARQRCHRGWPSCCSLHRAMTARHAQMPAYHLQEILGVNRYLKTGNGPERIRPLVTGGADARDDDNRNGCEGRIPLPLLKESPTVRRPRREEHVQQDEVGSWL